MNWHNHIESNPRVMFGKPVIKGTRIPVELILEKLSLGESMKQLLQAYPDLEETAVFACLAFAAESVRNEIILPKAS
ncbi:MAG: DUF433 domain-containing protein [Bacteroidota bacterium]